MKKLKHCGLTASIAKDHSSPFIYLIEDIGITGWQRLAGTNLRSVRAELRPIMEDQARKHLKFLRKEQKRTATRIEQLSQALTAINLARQPRKG